jgi:phosphatidylserine/phosphatidylglycerophosphate/cardiolipin synthase-like enzyme
MEIAAGTYYTHAPLASLWKPSNWKRDAESLMDTAWNHSKIVAVDGKVVITGGENLWGSNYLDEEPAHDVSMRLSGPAALDGHRFANLLWDHVCEPSDGGLWDRLQNKLMSTRSFATRGASTGCPAPSPVTAETTGAPAGGSPVVAVGRTGPWGTDTDFAVDDAILAMIGTAKTSVHMSLQDLGPVENVAVNGFSVTDLFREVDKIGSPFGLSLTKTVLDDHLLKWPTSVFDKVSEAIARGVDVSIVLSNKGSLAGGEALDSSYSNGWTTTDVARHFYDNARANAALFGGASETDVATTVCRRFHLASLRMSDGEETWPSGVPFANHGKYLGVDSRAFFLGSYNLYLPESLAEFGYVVDDAEVARQMEQGYWASVWRYSSRTAVTGTEVPLSSCVAMLQRSPG